MNTLMTFSRFVSAAGKASMIANDFAGDMVTVTEYDGSVHRCTVLGTSETPDGDPLLKVVDKHGMPGHFFAETIASVASA